EPYFARSWWPCKDYPDDKADSVDMIITYPSDLICSSNGSMIMDVDNLNGTRTTHWSVRYPIATYLVSLVITNFAHWREWWHYDVADSMPVDFWVFPDRLAAAQSGWAPTLDMLDTLSDRFGLYPFTTEKYAMSMFTWSGGMEHQTNTSMGSSATYQSITVHEMGHQWWGDMITCVDWGHIWLNEGFASYTEALWFESLGDFSDLQTYMNGMRYTSGGTIYCQDTTDVWSIFSGRVYDKGAWVLHMLRHVVGDQNFFDILHAYYDDPVLKFAHASTEDFRDVCEAVSGMELDEFFNDWIYGTYFPSYVTSFTYDQVASDSFIVYAQVRQTQTSPPQVFDFDVVDLSVYAGGVWHDFTESMTARSQNYVLHLGGLTTAPSDFTIDRNDWILKNETSEAYAVHIIYDTLSAGEQLSAYDDSLIVRGGGQPYNFQITSGSLPSGLNLGPGSGVISGTPVDTGLFAFTVQVQDFSAGTDNESFLLYIAPADYVPGDCNDDGVANVTDAVLIIQFIFSEGEPPVPFAAGDVNADCIVNITDAVYLIAYIFGSGPAPLPGCA
ncbi:MAG: M1 family aminopeptidase, partial [bacterium]